jgi:hypothetical protein
VIVEGVKAKSELIVEGHFIVRSSASPSALISILKELDALTSKVLVTFEVTVIPPLV